MTKDEKRDQQLKARLAPEIVSLLEKYDLKSDHQQIWYMEGENSFRKKIVKQSFLEKKGVLAAVFRIYGLCAAKLNYFSQQQESYEPCKYDLDKGFTTTELWDMEFLKHVPSGRYIDLRALQNIRDIEIFEALCRKLEGLEDAKDKEK